MQEGLPYGAEIKRRCLLFLDSGLKEFYDTVLVRRTTGQPNAYSAAFRKATWRKKNSMAGGEPSGSNFRLVYVAFHPDDEVASQRRETF